MDLFNHTPLDDAIHENNEDIIKYLKENGAYTKEEIVNEINAG